MYDQWNPGVPLPRERHVLNQIEVASRQTEDGWCDSRRLGISPTDIQSLADKHLVLASGKYRVAISQNGRAALDTAGEGIAIWCCADTPPVFPSAMPVQRWHPRNRQGPSLAKWCRPYDLQRPCGLFDSRLASTGPAAVTSSGHRRREGGRTLQSFIL